MFNLIPKNQKFYEQLESFGYHVVSRAGELPELRQKFPRTAQERAKALDAKEKGAARLVQSALERLDAASIDPDVVDVYVVFGGRRSKRRLS